VVPEPLEAGDQRSVEHRDLAVQNQRGRGHGPDGGHDGLEAPSVVDARAADQLHGGAVLVGHHPPAVHLFLVDPALAMEGPVDQGRLHQGDREETGRGHGSQYIGGRQTIGRLQAGRSRGRRGAGTPWNQIMGPA